jgi:hypothetical protein
MNSLKSNTTGTDNMAIGHESLYDNTAGIGNTAVGTATLYHNTTDYNTAVGFNSLKETTSGGNNAALGYGAGNANTTGYQNTFIGSGSNAGSNSLQNATAIGYGATVNASNDIVLGNGSLGSIHSVVTSITSTSDGRFKENVTENVKGLEFINKLRAVTYNLNTEALEDFVIQNLTDSAKLAHKQGMDFVPSSAIVHSGFIAQEVDQAAQDVGFSSSIVYHPSNEADPYGLGYAEFVVPLVKAVQELSKQLDSMKTAMNACCQLQQDKSMQINNPTSGQLQESTKITDVKLSNKNIIVLEQNVPNPFAEQTTISYHLPETVTRAQIVFFDLSGQIIKSVEISEKGTGQLNVFASDLSSGIYTYSLIADGVAIETKKMVKR